ncbi:MAG: DNA gyrase subunit A, partial [SAR92 clade bacterium]
NLKEVVQGCLALIENSDLGIDELMQIIPGPDFPTGGIINGRAGIIEAYKTGRGRIYVRAKADIEIDERTNRESIIISEIPYQLNKSRLIEKIAELVKDKKLEGIAELRDESDKDGMRIVIDLKRGEISEVVLNNLYAQTQMQSVFGINIVALVDDQPKILNLKEVLEAFIRHRQEIVTRRTLYLMRKARDRAHSLEGFAVALANIDEIIQIIKKSSTASEARETLVSKTWSPGENVLKMLSELEPGLARPEWLDDAFGLNKDRYKISPEQARDILDLRLHRLTGMEHEKIIEEFHQKLTEIAGYQEILGNSQILMDLIKNELEEIQEEFGDERRTEICESSHDLTLEDLISEEDRVVTISNGGYAKTQPLDDYQAQRRGGMGKSATAVKDEDFVEHLLIASTHSTILCFTNLGKVYWLKVFQIPLAGRNSRGRPVVNLLPLDEGERISSILPIDDYSNEKSIVMSTANGTVKKTNLKEYSRPRSVGLRAVDLAEGDYLVGTEIVDGSKDIMLFSSEGKAVRFRESDVRAMGRVAKGVRGMRLGQEHKVISMLIPATDGFLLAVCENGFGKRTDLNEFPTKGRGGKGMIAIQASDRNGPLVGATQLFPGDEIMLISDQGTMVRTRGDEISIVGRNTQGVRIIRLKENEHLVRLARISEPSDESPGQDNLETE